MIPAFGMVMLPRILVLRMGMFQAGVAFLAWMWLQGVAWVTRGWAHERNQGHKGAHTHSHNGGQDQVAQWR